MNGTVGFTNDGRVFFAVKTKGPGGQPINVTLTWTPQDAVNIAKKFMEAADKCHAKVKPANLIWTPGGA